MIKFFRRIRQRLLDENRFSKYLLYAIGEIVLVVIGILIALQINNWNDQRIAQNELDDLLTSMANGLQSDIRNLGLLANARESISTRADSIFNAYVSKDISEISVEEAVYITITFNNVLNYISFNPTLNAFEVLNSSNYIGKIQGTDLALLINAYYSSVQTIRSIEEGYNETLEEYRREWTAKFRNRDNVFLAPWAYANDTFVENPTYFEILRDDATKDILGAASSERRALRTYGELSLMATKLVEMIKNKRTGFDEQTKLDFSGILYSFGDADYLSVLINGQVPTGFSFNYVASRPFITNQYFQTHPDYIEIRYPDNEYDWAAAYIYVRALSGRVNEMDFSPYSKVLLEMKGAQGGENFQITMKDKEDPPDGTESRIGVTLTKNWKVYEFDTEQFETADMPTINVPISFVFQGPVGQKIHVRSIQFRQ